jgi:hypothetical protein
MRKVFKYTMLAMADDLYIPKGAQFLDAGFQDGEAVLWFLTDDTEGLPTEHRTFEIFGTGWDIDYKQQAIHLKTLRDGDYVWHLFERKPYSPVGPAFAL